MSLVLVYYKYIVVRNVVKSIADNEVFAASDAEENLTAIVDMYIGIRVSMLGIIDSEALVLAGVGDG